MEKPGHKEQNTKTEEDEGVKGGWGWGGICIGKRKREEMGLEIWRKEGKQRGQQEHCTYSRTLGFRGDQAADIFHLNRNTSQRNSRKVENNR